MTPARPLFMAAAQYVSSSWIWEPFVVCPLLHSVDHTGDGRNEEAESLFMLTLFFSMRFPVRGSANIEHLAHDPAAKDRCPRRLGWDLAMSNWHRQ
jgi:hypothetical protein